MSSETIRYVLLVRKKARFLRKKKKKKTTATIYLREYEKMKANNEHKFTVRQTIAKDNLATVATSLKGIKRSALVVVEYELLVFLVCSFIDFISSRLLAKKNFSKRVISFSRKRGGNDAKLANYHFSSLVFKST